MQIRRIVYLIYYLKELDLEKFRKYITYASEICGRTKIRLFIDMLSSVFRHNISMLDYFNLRFYSMDDTERTKWAGTGFMYEYQLKMNPKVEREVLADKIMFLNHFKQFVNRAFSGIDDLRKNNQRAMELLHNFSGSLVLKNSRGQIGAEVEVVRTDGLTVERLIEHMERNKYDLAEEYVIQHSDLMALSPTGLNTVRIITQLTGENVDFIGGRLRISVNSHVDNMAAGNIACAVDLNSGIVTGPGVFSDIRKPQHHFHPVTGMKITGFRIPFWEEVLNIARCAALLTPGNRSVGWDIAITPAGPELIEGNHNWCKLLWQLPVNKGLKHELEKYM